MENSTAIIEMIIYLAVITLAFIVPAAVIIAVAVNHKKEEKRKQLFYMQMMAEAEKRNVENQKQEH